MKKIILGTTALFAAGLIAAPAQAADPLKLDIGGYYRAAIGGVMDQDDSATAHTQTVGARDIDIKQDVEVHFSGETTLDNGVTVGAQIELEGNNEVENNDLAVNGTQWIDESWMYFKGSFGEIRVGDEDDARRLTGVTAPVASGLFGVNDPWFAFTNNVDAVADITGFDGENDTLREVERDSTKLIYFTPSMNGFTLAASYAPDGRHSGSVDAGNGGEGSMPTNNTAATNEVGDAISLGLRYDGDMQNMRVKFGAGWTSASAEEVNGAGTSFEPEAWAAGLNLGFDAWTVGASYGHQEELTDAANTETTVWDAGVTYETGPYQVGLAYSVGEYENGSGTSDPELSVWALTGSYAMGPGVALTGAITMNELDKDGATINGSTQEYRSTSVMLGTVARF